MNSSQLTDILLLLAAVALGCVNAGYYLVCMSKGIDVRQTGSGSSGATNVARLLGWRGFVLTLLLDAAKGAFAVGLARFFATDPIILVGCLVAVVACHVWPIQLGFRGGKGIAPYFGGLLCLAPALAGGFVVLTLVCWGVVRTYKLAGLGAVAGVPLLGWWFDLSGGTVLGLAIAGAIILIAHRANLREEIGKFLSPAQPEGACPRVAKRE